MKDDTNNEEKSKKKGVWKKLLIICVIVIVMCFTINKAFDIASNKIESMSQEEKETMNDKWDDAMDWLND